MKEDHKKTNLSINERYDFALEVIVSSVPYIGPPLSNIYFGQKRERRFKRLESFYKELSQRMDDIKDKVDIHIHDPDILAAIMENLHEKIEVEHLVEKRKYFQNYFINTLLHPECSDYDQHKLFLEILSSITLLECHILAKLFKQQTEVIIGDLAKLSDNHYSIIGSVNRIESYGIVETKPFHRHFEGDPLIHVNRLKHFVFLTSFGLFFCKFCLES